MEHYQLLWLSAPTISLLFFFVFRELARQNERLSYIRDWSYAYLIGAVGYFLNSSRVTFGDLVSIPANFCFGLVAVLTARGLYRRYKGRSPDKSLAVIWFAAQVGGLWMGFGLESVVGRGTFVGFGMALILLLASRAVLRTEGLETLDRALGLMTGIVAGMILMRPPIIVWLEGAHLRGTDIPTSFWLASHNFVAVTSWLTFAVLFAARIATDLLSRLDKTAKTDPLSGLLNRRGFEDAFKNMVSKSKNVNAGLLLIIDIDHFKSINDRFGHAVGDEVIYAVSSTLAANSPPESIVARIGGEEFVVVLPDCPPTAAWLFADAMRACIEVSNIAHDSGVVPVTVSIGAVSFQPNSNLSHCLARADAALYEAKAAGRNRVRLAVAGGDVADEFDGPLKQPHHNADPMRQCA